MKFNPTEHPHRRYNPLREEWVLVSPHRTKRPWQGQRETVADDRPPFDPKCYLCPGNARAGGETNPHYTGTYVFENDFAALLSEKPGEQEGDDDLLFRRQAVSGTCRVICFHPRHDLTLPQMQEHEILMVVETWIDQTRELGERYAWVQVFENKGAVMGCSNPHPHGQIWASDFVPNEPAIEDRSQRAYFQDMKRTMLTDYAQREIAVGERVVASNSHWAAVVPFWAVWPFEVLLLPLEPVLRLTDLTDQGRTMLASITKELLTRYDDLFETSFPVLNGLAWGAIRRRQSIPLAASCAFLSSAAALGHRQKVYGRIRNAWRGSARPDSRAGRRPLTRRSCVSRGSMLTNTVVR